MALYKCIKSVSCANTAHSISKALKELPDINVNASFDEDDDELRLAVFKCANARTHKTLKTGTNILKYQVKGDTRMSIYCNKKYVYDIAQKTVTVSEKRQLQSPAGNGYSMVSHADAAKAILQHALGQSAMRELHGALADLFVRRHGEGRRLIKLSLDDVKAWAAAIRTARA